MSTAYHPGTGLFYLQAMEKCEIYTKSSAWWEPGKSFYGGGNREIPGELGQKFLRALDLQTGKIVWEYPQIGNSDTWGGVLATAGGLVFLGEDSGAFVALDAKTGKLLWHFQTNQLWKASPMTYLAAGKQYVAVAAGPNIISFALP
jgi:alcohol dehydrogenase (cytochrome c)